MLSVCLYARTNYAYVPNALLCTGIRAGRVRGKGKQKLPMRREEPHSNARRPPVWGGLDFTNQTLITVFTAESR